MRFAGFRVISIWTCLVAIVVQLGCASVPISDASQDDAPSNDRSSNTGIRISTSDLPVAKSETIYWAPLAAQGGSRPYRWSLKSGKLPDGLVLDSQRGTISGNAFQNGHFLFTLRVQDSSQNSKAAEAPLFIDVVDSAMQAIGSFSGPNCARSGCYGPAIGADALANTTVGPHGNEVSYRFRAPRSGFLRQLRLYLIPDRAGYAGGTAGKLRIKVNEDDGTVVHNPSNRTLASFLLTAPLEATPSKYFPVVTFPAPPMLNSGQLYHVVFANEDSSPATNYLSVDALYVQTPTEPLQPAYDNLDYAVLLRSGDGQWSRRRGYTPIMELTYQDGWATGIGYIEAWKGAPQTISGINAVRETFTVTGSPQKVAQASVRVARLRGDDALKVRLEEGDGTLIEQGDILEADTLLTDPPSYVWVTFRFSTAHTLLPGETYHFVLQAATSSAYQTFPIRKGYSYGFRSSTYFPDGHAQFKQDGSWLGWTQWSATNRTDGDLPFYFGLAP